MKFLKINILLLFLINLNLYSSELKQDINVEKEEAINKNQGVEHVKNLIDQFRTKNKSRIIELLKEAFIQGKYENGLDNIDTNKIHIIPKLECDIDTPFDKSENLYFRISHNFHEDSLDCFVVMFDTVRNIYLETMIFNKANIRGYHSIYNFGEYRKFGNVVEMQMSVENFCIYSMFLDHKYSLSEISYYDNIGYSFILLNIRPDDEGKMSNVMHSYAEKYFIISNEIYNYLAIRLIENFIEPLKLINLNTTKADKLKLHTRIEKYINLRK